ncbi:MAG: hypothetical protein CVV42_00790 [Candidatus Riflebacteria bacterium HGW-Riflebacteria-2]|jgi:tetratricopeptide (TPR) repeat protein|nr:MAG: hypothetical protein CVV42_00790 [Candidatus Riflebacteria bacterium HGW-Riflebacteria-2]
MVKRRRINANYTFIQAYNLYRKAEKAESSDYIRALNLYQQALASLDSILERFPESSLALQIAQRKYRLGVSTYSGILRRIEGLRQKAWRQELLEILHDCARNIRQIDLCCEKLGDIAKLFSMNNQKARAVTVVSEAADRAEMLAESELRSHTLSSLAVKYADIGEYERALTLSVYFPDCLDQIRLLTRLGLVYFDGKMRERAQQLFISAIDLVERIVDTDTRMTAVAWIAYKLAESCEYYWAFEVAESISEPEMKLAVMHQIVEHLIGSGKYLNTAEIAKKIENSQIRAELAVSLVMKQAAEGFFSQAREAAAGITVTLLRARAFIAIAGEYKDRSLWHVAGDLINDAVKLVDSIPDVPARILVLTQAASGFHRFMQADMVRELLQRAFNLSLTLPVEQQRNDLATFLLKNSLDLNQMELASEMFATLKDVSFKNQAVVEIAARHALLDNFLHARSLISQIADQACRLRGYLRIVASNPANRNYRVKLEILNEVATGVSSMTPGDLADRIMSECALLFAKSERFHLALQLQERILSDANRDELLWRLAEVKCSSGFLEEGVEVVRLVTDQNRRIARMIELGIKIFNEEYEKAAFTVSDFLPIAFSFWLDEKEKLATG